MKKKIILTMAFIAMGIAFISGICILRGVELKKIDTVEINRLKKQAEQDWGHITEKTFTPIEYGNQDNSLDGIYDFAVINLKGSILYSTYPMKNQPYMEIINEVMMNYDTMDDIIVNNQLVGKVIIKNNVNDLLFQKEQHLFMVFLILLLFLLLLVICYIVFLEKEFFRPFHKLETFAKNVAGGNLEIHLKMEKENRFGAFTESFDLMRENLKTARLREYEANKSKQELIASLSHDIKTPIASIKAVSELMALTSQDKHITVIQEKAEQINHLVNDLFQSTLEELGQLKVMPIEHDSREIVSILKSVDYGMKIESLPVMPICLVMFDKLRLTQVFDNIIGNSYKYAGTPIEIRFTINQTCLQIELKDYGPGVKEEEVSLIGGKYYRGENAGNKDGSGLGLYVSHIFLDKMKGEMEYDNVEDGFLVKINLTLAGM